MKIFLLLIVVFTTFSVYPQCTVGDITNYTIIADDNPNFVGEIDTDSRFGQAAAIWDVDGNGVKDLIVGAPLDNNRMGQLRIIYLNADNSLKTTENISSTELTAELSPEDRLGFSVVNIGDIDGDGYDDLALGAPQDDDINNGGAVYIVFLDENAHIKNYQKLSATRGGGISGLQTSSFLGQTASISLLGDVNNDGINDIAVGAPRVSGGGLFFVLCLNTDGTIKEQHLFNETTLGFEIGASSLFGFSLTSLGDIDNNGYVDLAVCELYYTNLGAEYGAVHTILFDADWIVKTHTVISYNQGGFEGEIGTGNRFGEGLTNAGDVNGDGITDLLAGSNDDENGLDRGTAWLLYLDTDGSVKDYLKIDNTSFSEIEDEDLFAAAMSNLGDVNNDGLTDFGMRSAGYDGSKSNTSALYIVNICGATNVIAEEFSISGSVTANSEMVSSGSVKLYRETIEAQNLVQTIDLIDGLYTFPFLAEGTYYLVATPGVGYKDYKETVYPEEIILHSDLDNIHVTLEPITYSIAGTVLAGMELISEGTVYLYVDEFTNSHLLDSFTVTNGNFIFDNLVKGSYYVEALPTGQYETMYKPTLFPIPVVLYGNAGGINIELDYLTGMNAISQSEIYISPNPTNGKLSINGLNGLSKIEIVDISGAIIAKENYPDNSVELDLSQFSNGVYFVNITTDEGFISEKIILQK